MKHLILTISLILGATAVSADDQLPPANIILDKGKILHKEVYYQKDSVYDENEFWYANNVIAIQYIVLHQNRFYNCGITSEVIPDLNTTTLSYISCEMLTEFPTAKPRKN